MYKDLLSKEELEALLSREQLEQLHSDNATPMSGSSEAQNDDLKLSIQSLQHSIVDLTARVEHLEQQLLDQLERNEQLEHELELRSEQSNSISSEQVEELHNIGMSRAERHKKDKKTFTNKLFG